MPRLALTALLLMAALLSSFLFFSDPRGTGLLGPGEARAESRAAKENPGAPLPGHGRPDLRISASRVDTPVGAETLAGANAAAGRMLDVQLFDESLDVPIVGEITAAGGRRIATTDVTGEARIPWGTSGPGSLTFNAPGFEPLVTTPTVVDLHTALVVRLRPGATSRIEVRNRSGAPIPQVDVKVITRERLKETFFERAQALDDSAWSQRLLTDEAGVARASLSRRGVAELTAPSGARAQAWLDPGRTTRVTLDDEPATLRVVDAESGEPIVGFVVSLEETRQPAVRPVTVRSDGRGEIPIPSGADGVVLTTKDPRWKSASIAPHPAITPRPDGGAFRFDSVRSSETFVLEVDVCSSTLRLVDSRSGLLLEGIVTVVREHGREGHWSHFQSLLESVRLVDGFVHLDCIFLPVSKRERVRLRLPGYQDVCLPHTSLVKNAEPLTVPMERSDRRLAIQLRYADGLAARGRFATRDHGTGSIGFREEVDLEGILEMAPWSGADVTVYSIAGELGPRTEVGTIRAGQVVGGRAQLMLPAPLGRGTLVVEGVHPGDPPAMASTLSGTRYGSVRDNGRAMFEHLPAGEYLVGTRAWLDGVLSTYATPKSHAELLVKVVDGGETQVPWDERWAIRKAISGRVIATKERLTTLALRPWYGTAAGNVPPNDELRIPLDPAGRYVIPAGDPLPERLLVCASSDLYWIEVLQSFLPGKNVEVPSGKLTIEWEGPVPEGSNLTVFVQATDLPFDAPFEQSSPHGYYREWTGAAPLVFDAVSTHVDHIQFDAKGYARTSLPVTIDPQIEARLTVSLKDFQRYGK